MYCIVEWRTRNELCTFLASQDAIEVMFVAEWVTEWLLALTLLIWLWWVRIPVEDEEGEEGGEDEEDEEDKEDEEGEEDEEDEEYEEDEEVI